MVQIRIVDPTGGFNLIIGGRNTPLAGIFRKLPVPSFVSVTGRAQMYLKHGEANLSVRPDNILVVDRQVRDQWVLATAKSTLAASTICVSPWKVQALMSAFLLQFGIIR
jgi:RPA family protein